MTGPRVRAREIEAFVEALFPDVDGLIELRGFAPVDGEPPRFRRFVPTVDDAIAAAQAAAGAGLNVSVGPATRRSRRSGRKANLASAVALWADLDPVGSETAANLERRVESVAPAASAVVRSGAGVHAYWLLEEAQALDGAPEIAAFEATLKGLAAKLGADIAATDASRVMRVAGTVNYPPPRKRAKGRAPAVATIARLDPDVFYPFEAFAAFTKAGRSRATSPVAYARADWDGSLPTGVAGLLESDDDVRRLLSGAAGRGNGGDESRADFELARCLAWRRVAGADIEHALRWRRARFGTDKRKGAGYFARTTQKALGLVAEKRSRLRRLANGG